MGQAASVCQTDHPNPHEESQFLSLPPEIRIKKILALHPPLNFEDHQRLRQVCRQLLKEIDLHIGPSPNLFLDETQSQEISEFFGRTYFPHVSILKSYLGDYSIVIQFPNRLISFTLGEKGLITSEFASELLQKSVNLKSLSWSGVVNGLICLGQGKDQLRFSKLTSLQIDSSSSSYTDIFDPPWILKDVLAIGFQRIQEWWDNESHCPNPQTINSIIVSHENTLFLLNNLKCPKLKIATLVLMDVCNQAGELHDQFEILEAFFNFLENNPSLRRVKVLARKQKSRQWLLNNGPIEEEDCLKKEQLHHSLCFYKKYFWPKSFPSFKIPVINLIPEKVQKMNLTHFDFSSSWDYPHSPESHKVFWNLTKNLSQLQNLKFQLPGEPPSFTWMEVDCTIFRVAKTLTHLDLTLPFKGDIDFHSFYYCSNLKYLRLHSNYKTIHKDHIICFEEDDEEASMTGIKNFGSLSYDDLYDNLETLILGNIIISSEEDTESFGLFTNLHKLILYDSDDKEYPVAPKVLSSWISCEGLQSILHLRGLDHLFIQIGSLIRPSEGHYDPVEKILKVFPHTHKCSEMASHSCVSKWANEGEIHFTPFPRCSGNLISRDILKYKVSNVYMSQDVPRGTYFD